MSDDQSDYLFNVPDGIARPGALDALETACQADEPGIARPAQVVRQRLDAPE